MLKSWSIQNFKPILDSGELALAPVTVLAGRNSSGKSSLIQSILMIAQTLSSRLLDRALLPNESIVQLGTFEDILSEQIQSKTLKVGFKLEIEREEQKEVTSTRYRQTDKRFLTRLSSTIHSVNVISEFRSASMNGTSSSAIEASKVKVERVSLNVIALLRPRLIYSEKQITLVQERDAERLTEFGLDIRPLSLANLE